MLLLLALSAALLAAAPVALPPAYSWIVHTTSESAAQGLQGAWIARLGFQLFGFAVLWLASLNRDRWGRWGSVLLGCFGVMMLATAAFSHRPWLPDVPFDQVEDLLHSFTATVMGLAFAIGVLVVAVARTGARLLDRVTDAIAVLASVLLPLAMSTWPAYEGLLQRLMFLIAYAWFAHEAFWGATDPRSAR